METRIKTAEEWIAGNRILTMGDVKTIQLEAYRAGMESAARMCRDKGDTISGHSLGSDYESAGCYACYDSITMAAKTAQLPSVETEPCKIKPVSEAHAQWLRDHPQGNCER